MSRVLRIVDDAHVGAPGPSPAPANDLLQAAEVEFVFAFARRSAAGAFAETVELLAGFRIEPPQEGIDGLHRVRALRAMVPRQLEVATCLRRLLAVAEPFGGRADSWGCIQVDRLH